MLSGLVGASSLSRRTFCTSTLVPIRPAYNTFTGSSLANLVRNSLATVNFFLGCVGLIQSSRILAWRSSHKGDSVTQEAKDAAKEEGAAGKKILKDPVGAAKAATKN